MEVGERAGVFFIATGAAYVQAACRALDSVRATCPRLEAALATDLVDSPEARCFDVVLKIDDPHYRSKVDMLSKSPFHRTIYLDTDVRVVEDLQGVIDLLARFDIALAHAHTRNRKETNRVWRVPLPNAFPQCNGGVIAYRMTPKTKEFFHEWSESFASAKFKKDQVTLRELLWASDLRLYILPPEFNVRYLRYLNFWRVNEATPKILHLAKYHQLDAPFSRWMSGRYKEIKQDVASGLSVVGGAFMRLLKIGSRSG